MNGLICVDTRLQWKTKNRKGRIEIRAAAAFAVPITRNKVLLPPIHNCSINILLEDDESDEADENPEEVRRRKEIADRIEKERAKKETVQNKRKRFI